MVIDIRIWFCGDFSIPRILAVEVYKYLTFKQIISFLELVSQKVVLFVGWVAKWSVYFLAIIAIVTRLYVGFFRSDPRKLVLQMGMAIWLKWLHTIQGHQFVN